MAVLEIGINLGSKKLVENKYYSSSDNVLDPNIRARFLNGLEDFVNEVFGDKINIISLSNFEIICYYKMIQNQENNAKNLQPLFIFAITEKGTDHDFVNQHLKQIYSLFFNKYALNDIFVKEPEFFEEIKPKIDDILGDLRFKLEDRIRSVFRD